MNPEPSLRRPERAWGAGKAAPAVYLHIPFCLARCPYCSFSSLPYSRQELSNYLRHLLQELRIWRDRAPWLTQARTLYFGGGTPSLLNSGQINAVCGEFELTADAGITLEINPLQITGPYLAALRETPVNRLSIGVQSLNDADLAWLGRRHRAAQIPGLIRLCRDHGFASLSLDLIYGLPGSDAGQLRQNLERYLALEPDHLSAYLLTPDPDTPLGQKLRSGEEGPLPDEENLASQYLALCQTLRDAGFEQYEISNFCRPGHASVHNLAYWKSEPWLALGASAAGWLPPLRYGNPAALDQYYQLVERRELPAGAENCSSEQARADHIMMGLRLLRGLDLKELQNLYQYDLLADKAAQIAKLKDHGLISLEGSQLRLTSQALFVSNAVIGELL